MDNFLHNFSIFEAKGVQIETPKYAFRKVFKKGDLMTSQNSENGVPVQAGVQLTVIWEGNFWSSELCRFGGTFGSVETQCSHQKRPKEYFERLQKQSTVNRGISTSPPPPGGRGRHAFELY